MHIRSISPTLPCCRETLGAQGWDPTAPTIWTACKPLLGFLLACMLAAIRAQQAAATH